MRSSLFSFAVLVLCAPLVRAQEHLVPDVDVFVDPDNHKLMMRHVFARAFEDGVTLRVLVTPSFQKEYAAGLRRVDQQVEVFVLEPSVQIWNLELIRMYESGEIGPLHDDGNEVPLERNPAYQKLKKETPSDYRKIKAERRSRPIPEDLASQMEKLWAQMLLNVQHPAEDDDGLDGTTYDFSGRVRGRGTLSGHIWTPEPTSKTGRLTALAETMADYARAKASLETLKEKLKAARAP
jgi:hypothetical protein